MSKIKIFSLGGGALNDPTGSAAIPVFINSSGDVESTYNTVETGKSGALSVNISGNAATVTHTTGSNFYVSGYASSANNLLCSSTVMVDTNNRLIGGAWNDYAEYYKGTGNAGLVVSIASSDGLVSPSIKRLQKNSYIVSDTFGYAIGETSQNSIPVAVCGKVLAYTDNKNLKVGDVVCSGKNGTVSKMSRLEVILFPDRIIGVVCEVPNYETWGPDNLINVDKRIWIKIR